MLVHGGGGPVDLAGGEEVPGMIPVPQAAQQIRLVGASALEQRSDQALLAAEGRIAETLDRLRA